MNDATRYQELNRTARWYNRLLDEAQAVSQRSLDRLRELNRRVGLPKGSIAEFEELVALKAGSSP
jgi:hypothetical protein